MKKKYVSIIVFFIGLFFGMATAYAYVIEINGGFSPVTTTVYGSDQFSSGTKTAINNACVEWNNAGCGDLIYRSVTDHSNTNFPYDNDRNEITKLDQGNNGYLMGSYRYTTTPFPWIYTYITEYDININIYYSWSNEGESNYFDIGNSMTHELGHLLGLAHTSGTECTMYGSTSLGELKKRTLESDDESGAQAIY